MHRVSRDRLVTSNYEIFYKIKYNKKAFFLNTRIYLRFVSKFTKMIGTYMTQLMRYVADRWYKPVVHVLQPVRRNPRRPLGL